MVKFCTLNEFYTAFKKAHNRSFCQESKQIVLMIVLIAVQ